LLNTGEEVIHGSTRLKAGTSQKICLNLISTMVMVKLNKVKNGQMIYVVPSNEKLRKRKKEIEIFLNNNL
jgi:N-acetylmuramic acid 6-phosphate etherase